jgi:hypothetical protein
MHDFGKTRRRNTMKLFARIILLALGLGGVVVGLSFFPRRPVAAAPPTPSIPVNITNTPLPVSLSGNGTISGNVSATQSGTWNVGITGTPSVNVGTPTVTLGTGSTVGINGSVQVGNPATNPVLVRDLDGPARNPFQVEVCSGTSFYCPSIPNYFNVPVGQEFVIEYVSGKCEGPAGKVSLAFNTTAGGQLGAGSWLNDLTITDTTGIRFGQVTRIYADPRTQIAFGTNFYGGQGQGCDVNLSGYLVTL